MTTHIPVCLLSRLEETLATTSTASLPWTQVIMFSSTSLAFSDPSSPYLLNNLQAFWPVLAWAVLSLLIRLSTEDVSGSIVMLAGVLPLVNQRQQAKAMAGSSGAGFCGLHNPLHSRVAAPKRAEACADGARL